MNSLYQILKLKRFSLIFIPFIYIDPEQMYVMEGFKGFFIILCQNMCDQNCPKFATCSEWHNFMNC